MGNDGSSVSDYSNKIGENLVVDLPIWLLKAVEQKNPRLEVALAHSMLLEYDELDKALLLISTLN